MTGMINTIKDAFPTFEDEQDGKKQYFVSKIVLSSVRKNCSSDREKLLKYEAEGQELAKKFELSRTIYLNLKY